MPAELAVLIEAWYADDPLVRALARRLLAVTQEREAVRDE